MFSCASVRLQHEYSSYAICALAERSHHLRRYERDAALAAVEALCIHVRVLANHHPLWNPDAAVDDDLIKACVAANLYIRQHHGVTGLGERVDPAIREQERAFDVSAGNNTAARNH